MAGNAVFVPMKMVPDVDALPLRRQEAAVQLEIVLKNGKCLLVPSSVESVALVGLLPILEGE